MRIQRIAVVLTLCNTVLFLLAWSRPATRPAVEPILRANALEIVDQQGRVRAAIFVANDTVMNGKRYPETVLLRLIDPASGPVVKLTAAANGSALSLSDDAKGGVQLFARDTGSFVRVVSNEGRTSVLRP